MKKIEVVVTRHRGLIEYLQEINLVSGDVEGISHASPEAVTGKHVCGVLPHSLSCLCSSFTEVPLVLPVELRGQELTLAQVRQYAQPAVTYKITRL